MTTSAPHRYISSTLTTLRLLWTAGRHWDLRLVRLGGFLLVRPNKRQPMTLLPGWRSARAFKPGISGLPWATESGHDLRGGIVSDGISEGHGQTLPDKKKYAMQKKSLRYVCNADRVSACPTTTNISPSKASPKPSAPKRTTCSADTTRAGSNGLCISQTSGSSLGIHQTKTKKQRVQSLLKIHNTRNL